MVVLLDQSGVLWGSGDRHGDCSCTRGHDLAGCTDSGYIYTSSVHIETSIDGYSI